MIHDTTRIGIAVLAMALTLSAAPACAVELVVVDGKGVDLKTGQKFDGEQTLKLDAGQRVTFVAADGRTLRLKGPYNEAPAPGAAAQGGNVLDALKNLTTQRTASTATLGAVRAATAEAEIPDPWVVDVSHTGHRCVVANSSVVLWRASSGQPAEMELWPTDRSWRARANWPGHSDRLGLPPTLPLRDLQSYIVTVDGRTASMTVHVLPDILTTEVLRVAWMYEVGCGPQAAALVRAVERR